MILVGNQRGGAQELALHLLKDENDHVDVHDLRGFASETLPGALNEAYAISRGTRCKQFLFSLSLNPPQNEQVPTEHFEAAIARIEDKLGLANQPRAIVFHEKEGRRHAHAVWSRIDTNEMKAVHLPFTKRKLMEIARELYLEHGWQIPKGLMQSEARDPKNFSLEEWQQAKRIDKDPKAIKAGFQESWAASDSKAAFTAALKERGYWLAKGDRRGHVAVDLHGEIHAITRRVGIKTKEVRARLGNEAKLPSIAEQKTVIANTMTERLKTLHDNERRMARLKIQHAKQQRDTLVKAQCDARKAMKAHQEARTQQETMQRQQRYNKGIRGLVDRFTGKHKRIKEQNERETLEALQRDKQEKDHMVFEQLRQRRAIALKVRPEVTKHKERQQDLRADLSRYREMKQEAEQSENQREFNQRVKQSGPELDYSR